MMFSYEKEEEEEEGEMNRPVKMVMLDFQNYMYSVPGRKVDYIRVHLLITLIHFFSIFDFISVILFRAGHFRYFFIFSIIKNFFLAFFIRLITYFCTSPM